MAEPGSKSKREVSLEVKKRAKTGVNISADPFISLSSLGRDNSLRYLTELLHSGWDHQSLWDVPGCALSGGPLPATEEIQHMCDSVKGQVEARTKTTYKVFKAVEYRVKNNEPLYLIKVEADNNDYLHLMVYVFFVGIRFPPDIILMGVQDHHKKDDPLVPFRQLK